VAEAFASLSLLYPRRIFLGLGSGEALNEQAATGLWPKWPERSERLVEAAEVIRKLWTGQQISHHGKYYTLDAKLYDPPTDPIPLLMAANVGPKAMYRSGQYGDGLITDPETWKQHRAAFESGAGASGKDPKRMPVLVEQFVVVAMRTMPKPRPSYGSSFRRLSRAISTFVIRKRSRLGLTPSFLSRRSTASGKSATTPTFTQTR
jgi:alkanesulfonate monooxygenase SsuD/methylene tetrahydromethanopterin reductase-like flavin-dependent oxidoreductase (luciferase family)